MQPQEHLELAKKVLSWITYAHRPLKVIELRHALAIEVGASELDEDNIPEGEDLISACAGLVTIDQESNVVRLVHYTTHEYFERIRLSWLPSGPTDISICCLTYLSFNVFSIRHRTERESFALIRENALLDYVSQFWGVHTCEALQMCEKEGTVKESLERFFRLPLNIFCLNMVLLRGEIFRCGEDVPEHISVLHLVPRLGLQQLMPLALRVSPCPDCKDSNWRTPLSYAAMYGQEAIVKLLLERDDVEADSKDILGYTPLTYAARWGHEAIVKRLLELDNVQVNSKVNSGQTPLSYATEKEHETIVKLLLNRDDLQVHSTDKRDKTPFSRAVESGHVAVVKLLLGRKDININLKDKKGNTALDLAIKRRHSKMVDLLLARNDITVVDAK